MATHRSQPDAVKHQKYKTALHAVRAPRPRGSVEFRVHRAVVWHAAEGILPAFGVVCGRCAVIGEGDPDVPRGQVAFARQMDLVVLERRGDSAGYGVVCGRYGHLDGPMLCLTLRSLCGQIWGCASLVLRWCRVDYESVQISQTVSRPMPWLVGGKHKCRNSFDGPRQNSMIVPKSCSGRSREQGWGRMGAPETCLEEMSAPYPTCRSAYPRLRMLGVACRTARPLSRQLDF